MDLLRIDWGFASQVALWVVLLVLILVLRIQWLIQHTTTGRVGSLEKIIKHKFNADDKVHFWLEDKNAKKPERGHKYDAGVDLFVRKREYYNADGTLRPEVEGVKEDVDAARVKYYFNAHVALPSNTVGFLHMRSSVADYGVRLSNASGTIDRTYRGELMGVFDVIGINHYKVGDKAAQLVVLAVDEADWLEVAELHQLGVTDRGNDGFGSTGKR
jgi:dUTP pyrophosphatase